MSKFSALLTSWFFGNPALAVLLMFCITSSSSSSHRTCYGHGETVSVLWLYSAIVLRFDVLRFLLEQKLQNGCLGNSAV